MRPLRLPIVLLAILASAPPVRGARPPAFRPGPCVADAGAALNALPRTGGPRSFHHSSAAGLDRYFSHWQGIQRLSTGDGEWLAVSRSGSAHAVGIVSLAAGSVIRELPAPVGYDHGGGIQAQGDVLVVPYERKGHGAVVALYDVADPRAPRLLHAFSRHGLPPSSDPTHASAAGIVRLGDGRYLLVVGVRSSKVLDFYLSNGAAVRDPAFEFRHVRTLRGVVEGGFQNLNLLAQCDGGLYLIGTRNSGFPPPSMGADLVIWYRLRIGTRDDVTLVREGRRHLDCRRCNFGAGAGIQVTSAGDLRLYAIEHADGGSDGRTVMFEEFAPGSTPPAAPPR